MKERTINMFKTGTLVMTQGIKAETDRNPIFIKEILLFIIVKIRNIPI